ncbi:ferredoxin [Patescibacteria group bacterium]|nr:ferredoxin [Patescibacteria group bacterium]
MFKITLDQEKCIGCGACSAICPNNFEMNEENKAEVKEALVENLGCNKLAEENCPSQAIKAEYFASEEKSEEGNSSEEEEEK